MQEGTKDGNSDYGSRARHATGLASDLDHGGVLESPEVCSDVCIMQQSLGWSRHLDSRGLECIDPSSETILPDRHENNMLAVYSTSLRMRT